MATLGLMATPARAQRVSTPSVSAPADTVPVRGEKSRAIGVIAGTVFPGSAHWYACEDGRGWTAALIYWSGVAVVQRGRTDTVGKVGGVALLGALAFSIIDGVRAVGRHNERVRAGVPTACARRSG